MQIQPFKRETIERGSLGATDWQMLDQTLTIFTRAARMCYASMKDIRVTGRTHSRHRFSKRGFIHGAFKRSSKDGRSIITSRQCTVRLAALMVEGYCPR